MDVRHWIFEAWGTVSCKIVRNSFKIMGICNKLNGMENAIIPDRVKIDVLTSVKEV